MIRCHDNDRELDGDVAERISAAYGRLYDHQVDVDAARRAMLSRVTLDLESARVSRRRLRNPWMGAAAAAAIVAILTVLPQLRLAGSAELRSPHSRPMPTTNEASEGPASSGAVGAATSPLAIGAKAGAPTPVTGKRTPRTVRRSRPPISQVYSPNPGATQVTVVVPAAAPGQGGSCAWILAAEGRSAQIFRASPSSPSRVKFRVGGAKKLSIKSIPSHRAPASGRCAINHLRVAGADPVSPAGETAPSWSPAQPAVVPSATATASTTMGQASSSSPGTGTP